MGVITAAPGMGKAAILTHFYRKHGGKVEAKDCTTSSCHTVFGYVISGQEHVDTISEIETQNDSPVDPVRIISARIV